MAMVSALSAASTLADDDEMDKELVLITASAPSTLEDELLRLALEV